MISSNDSGNVEETSPTQGSGVQVTTNPGEVSKFPKTVTPGFHHRVSFSYPKGYFSQNSGLDNLMGAIIIPYQVTVKDKMRYHSITMMKVGALMKFTKVLHK